ncbi:MAG: N-acetylmuramoyl-L-alanine amidase [Candidatus Neomarinimicrobiota bacterium]
MKISLRFIFLLVLTMTFLQGSSVRVINRVDNQEDEISTLENMRGTYISSKDVSRVLAKRQPFVNDDRYKMVLYLGDHRIKISSQSSYVLVDDQVYQMPSPAIWHSEDIYLPAEPFFLILRKTTLPGLTYDSQREILDIDLKEFNVLSVNISEKANGTIIRIRTREKFPEGAISSFSHGTGWFYLTISGGVVDTSEIRRSDTRGVVRNITADQLGESAQIAFRLGTKVESHELYQSGDPSEIVLSLRTELSKSVHRIKAVKDRWKLDTVVLDAGHGGKDPGTIGLIGTREKDIALDIVKRVGYLLRKNTKVKVIYTREEDVFVPLWKRTKMANEAGGKIFVSVHLNSSPNRSAKGFETFLLRPGKTEDAIAVSSRENAVIKMEDKNQNQYQELTGESLIMATMAQSMFMKESENLAAVIQEEINKKVKSKNRGVKQAGFHVLVGASMPNVLVEAGFLTNKDEEKKLRQPAYRKLLAEAIFKALVKFRSSREQVLAEG